jgi:hypothetical protein
LKEFSSKTLINFKDYLCEINLKFKIVDETSKEYAYKFLSVFPERLEKLVMVDCQLNSNMVSQIFPGYDSVNLCEQLSRIQELNLARNTLDDDVFTTIGKFLK